MNTILNAFTVDVEDYYQVSAFDHCVRREQWDEFPSRVVASTHRMLRLLERHQVQATFFVLGWVADRFPQLVRDIHEDGHEIASHGYWHRLIYQQTPDEFRVDLRHSRNLLQDIIGEPVTSYRAPSFSIVNESLWALQILAEEGFTVDSSVFPVRHDRYGIPDAQCGIHRRQTSAGPVCEVPPSVARLAGQNIPMGGGWFRLYPYAFTHACLRRVNRVAKQPVVFYTHPWELDAEQPRVTGVNWRRRWRHRVNLAFTETKLGSLLSNFRFGTLRQVVSATQLTDAAPLQAAELAVCAAGDPVPLK